MNDLTAMFERQSAWQRSRGGMSWTEKLRLAVELRKAAIALRGSYTPTPSHSPAPSSTARPD